MDDNNRIDGIREPAPQAESRLKPEHIIFRRTENLKERTLTAQDRINLCSYIRNNPSTNLKSFCQAHSLKRTTVIGWLSKYDKCTKNNSNTFYDNPKGGRPPLIDSAFFIDLQHNLQSNRALQTSQTIDLQHNLQSNRALQTSQTRSNAMEGLQDAIQKSANQRGVIARPWKSNRQSYARWCTHQHLCEVKGQTKDRAPRNFYSCFSMCYCFCCDNDYRNMSPYMIGNWDSTNLKGSLTSEEVCLIWKNDNLTNPVTSESSSDLDVFVRLLWGNVAAGLGTVPIWCVADPNMNEEDCDAYLIPGLGNTNDISNQGYLVFTKTRAMNTNFFKWFGKEIIGPFVKLLREKFNCKNNDGTPMRAFWTCDGEMKMIESFQDPEMLAVLAECFIDFGKLPASCSGALQPSDVMSFFKKLKLTLSEMHTKYKDLWHDDNVKNRITEIFAPRRFSADKKKKYISVLQQVSYAAKLHNNPPTIQFGFRDSGLWPLNFDKCFSRCSSVRANKIIEHNMII